MTLEAEVKQKAASEQSMPSESCSKSNIQPPWLMSNLSELDERMKKLDLNMLEGENKDGTFKERAEFYFEKRPELLALLQDLYNGYISLSDRYIQTLIKQNPHHQRQSSQLSLMDTVCYQPSPPRHLSSEIIDGNAIVAQFVIKNIEFDILLDEVSVMEKKCNESSRKIELQKSLLEVLDSERVTLMDENSKLCHEVPVLVEENKKLASESLLVKKKASEMARCLIKTRDEQMACMLSKKIEDLQKKIEGLEKRNEYNEQIMNKKCYNERIVNKKNEYYERVVIKVHRPHQPNRNLKKMKMKMKKKNKGLNLKVRNGQNLRDANSGKKGSKWWGKFKNMHLSLNLGCKPTLS